MVHEGPYQDKAKQIYSELRKNVVDNVVKVCGTKALQAFTKNHAGVRTYGIRMGTV